MRCGHDEKQIFRAHHSLSDEQRSFASSHTQESRFTMRALQLVLCPEREENARPSPPRPHIIKRRNSASSPTRRANPRLSRTPLVVCPFQSYRSLSTPKTLSRRRSRHFTIHHSTWMALSSSSLLDLPRVCFHFCSTVIEAVISTTTVIAQGVSTMLQNWWSGNQEDGTASLKVVEHQTPAELQGMDGILEENDRLKRILEFAVTSHVIMNEATSMLEDGAELWMKQAEEFVDAKVHEAELQRDALAIELQGLQEQLGDKDQEIERLRDGFVWATENLNAKEDEICELHERLEALLKAN